MKVSEGWTHEVRSSLLIYVFIKLYYHIRVELHYKTFLSKSEFNLKFNNIRILFLAWCNVGSDSHFYLNIHALKVKHYFM
jgi:hypothetical protein